MAATLLRLHGLEASLDGPAIEALLDHDAIPERRPIASVPQTPVEPPSYTPDEEARMIERLRDLGYV
jgi:hypothetical protein